eukprot:COSAG03_NODE_25660_length_264_cov_0.630303_1_plen_39_part_01
MSRMPWVRPHQPQESNLHEANANRSGTHHQFSATSTERW